MNFFSEYPRFFFTSKTSAEPERLNRRYDVLIQKNIDLIRGRRVLDIASHDGRWTFAALKAGAAHVTGIEARQHLVSNAEQTFAHYGISNDRYLFVCRDFFDAAASLTCHFDTIFCFGFFYHTLRQAELMTLVAQFKASAVIIDTAIIPSPVSEASFRVVREPVSDEGNGSALPGAFSDEAIVGIPTVGAIVMLLDYFGYDADVVDWSHHLGKDLVALGDYAKGERATVLGRRRTP